MQLYSKILIIKPAIFVDLQKKKLNVIIKLNVSNQTTRSRCRYNAVFTQTTKSYFYS